MNKKFLGLLFFAFSLSSYAMPAADQPAPAANKLIVIRTGVPSGTPCGTPLAQRTMLNADFKGEDAGSRQEYFKAKATHAKSFANRLNLENEAYTITVNQERLEPVEFALADKCTTLNVIRTTGPSENPLVKADKRIMPKKADLTEDTDNLTEYIGLQEVIDNYEIKEDAEYFAAYKRKRKKRGIHRIFDKFGAKKSRNLSDQLVNSAHHYARYGEEQHLAFKMIQQESELFCAVEESNLDLLKKCLETKENANARDVRGNTPLHYAADIACIQELLKHNASANAVDSLGNTPLHYAVTRNSLECVQYLIEHGGAFVLLVNNKNETPYDIAIKYGYDAIIQYFESREKSDMQSAKSQSKEKKRKSKSKKSEKIEKADIDALVKSTTKLSLS